MGFEICSHFRSIFSYKVIKFFHDLQDTVKTKGGEICHAYNVGDTYPREGYKPSADRIAELAGSDNKQRTPLIELQEDSKETSEEKTVKEESVKEAKARRGQSKSKPE